MLTSTCKSQEPSRITVESQRSHFVKHLMVFTERKNAQPYGPASSFLDLYSRCKELHVHTVTGMMFKV